MNSMTTLGAKTILLAIRDNPESAIDTLELKVTQKKTPHSHITYLRVFGVFLFIVSLFLFDLHITMKFGQANEKNAI